MTQATRCPACGTVFRVVPDQLKVSAGWVRCGRCGDVFDASKALFELDAAGLPLPPAGAAVAGPPVAVAAEPLQAEPPAAAANDEPPPAAAHVRSPLPPLSAAGAAAVPAVPAMPEASPPAAETAQPRPGFLLRAQRAEARRGRRWPAAVLAPALLLLLGGQIALHFRDHFAAAWPATRPPLAAACRLLGCELRAPLRIEGFTVESVVLRRLDESPMHLLQLAVRNRAATAARLPAIDLALTDLEGRTTARRMIEAQDLGAGSEQLPAQGEVTLQLLLDLGDTRVAGYTVELFYP
jgi:predicted Zn finger-like uncharacterized protein